MTQGWWRRNVWGVILVLPLIAGLFAVNADLLFEANYRQPASVDADGSVALGDYRVAIASIESVTADDDEQLAGVQLPGSVQVWRVVAEFTGPGDSCQKVTLTDEQDRVYAPKPAALGYAGSDSCLPDELDAPSPYTTTFYFLLPSEASPKALQIIWPLLLPRYVELPLGG